MFDDTSYYLHGTCEHIHRHTYTRTHTHTHTYTLKLKTAAQGLITLPPTSTTAALDTNATFYCEGLGKVLWQINGTQTQEAYLVQAFTAWQVFSPLPRFDDSELIVTASRLVNATLEIQCVVDPGIQVGRVEKSEIVRLFVYGKLILSFIWLQSIQQSLE